MARDRQRSKQRQQQRREERLARRNDPKASDATADAAAADGKIDAEEERDIEELIDLEVGAPPEDVGRSDRTLREDPPPPSFDTDDDTLVDDQGDELDDFGTRDKGRARGAERGHETADKHKRGRLVAFLVAVWAELQRVQWPDRRQLTQLTGVVLFFVLIVGAYLGGLDAIFSKLIQAIL
jgi:preprotein translocase subunit SecE